MDWEKVRKIREYIENPPLERDIEILHTVEFERVQTNVPRWKSGVRLAKRIERSTFDLVHGLADKYRGKYNKDFNCWVFSSEKRREDFIREAHDFKPFKTKLREILSSKDIHYDFDKDIAKILIKGDIPPCNWKYKIEDGYVVIKEDEYFSIEDVLEDILIIANKGFLVSLYE